jgi:radical SAM superfamily enzyme YgiQ (UPF0313 family)
MQVLAIRSPSIINNLATTISPALPIGLAYVVAAIKDLVDIEVIDPIAEKPFISELTPFKNGTSILGLTPEETLERIQHNPDVCLISSMFSMEWPITQGLINQIKEKYPKCIIIGGGEHFNATAEYSLRHSHLDICVLGEGEASLREFVERMIKEKKMPIDARQLHEIRWPAWEYFNVNGFLDSGVSNTGNGVEGFRAMPIVASRGCPYKCTFCSNSSMWGTLWRARTPQDVLDEMVLANPLKAAY